MTTSEVNVVEDILNWQLLFSANYFLAKLLLVTRYRDADRYPEKVRKEIDNYCITSIEILCSYY